MSVKNCVTIDQTAFVPGSDSTIMSAECDLQYKMDWGTADIKAIQIPHILITEIKSSLDRNLHVRHHEDRECATVNSCFTLSGSVNSDFYGLQNPLRLHQRTQNFIYKPVLCDSHYLTADENPLHMFHYEVDVNYFITLLDLDERWADQLRERITRRQVVTGPQEMMPVSGAMFRCIHDIINTPLTGALRNIIIEAKILELIAHQLDHVRQRQCDSRSSGLTRAEVEKFHALKSYLEASFQQEHSLRSLARKYAMNEFKLKKGFKELFGDTIFAYIHSLKMKEARLLLEEQGLNVTQVSVRTGYKNPNHFSAAFKKSFGISPSALCR